MRIDEHSFGNVVWNYVVRYRQTMVFAGIFDGLLIMLSLIIGFEDLTRFINSSVAGILLGILFAFVGGPTKQFFQQYERFLRKLKPFNGDLDSSSLPKRRYYFSQDEFPELIWRYVLLGGAVFGLSGIIGRGVVFGINLSGSHGFAGMFFGAVGGCIIGALWGIFLIITAGWFDHTVLGPN